MKGWVTDYLKINGNIFSGSVLTIFMGKISAINYWFKQVSENKIVVNMTYNDESNLKKGMEFMFSSLKSNLNELFKK